MINDLPVSPHFKLREFQCRCCASVKLCPRLLERLEALRAAWGRPIVITSGYRCDSRNKAVGGAIRSLHLRGMAADIAAPEREQPRLRELAGIIGFSEIIPGGSRNYLHVAD